jgi:hypothetical protein
MDEQDHQNLSMAKLVGLGRSQLRQSLRWQSHFCVALGGIVSELVYVCVGQGPAATRERQCANSAALWHRGANKSHTCPIGIGTHPLAAY